MHETQLATCLSYYCGLYNVKLFSLIKQYESLTNLYELFLSNSTEVPEKLKKYLNKAWGEKQFSHVQSLLERHAISALLYSDPKYPPLLREITDPPYVLYVKGDIACLHTCIPLSAVGTRALSSYGKRVIHHLLSPLASIPLVVISGLALGVDAEVHRVCLQNNLLTVAVLAGGLDRYEPLTNNSIGKEIERTACMLSEYPPGIRPQKHQFLERNRIIAGLSKATIIIEGKGQSGSLVTARFALHYGRDVGVIPGDIFLPNSEAPLRLLKDGATPLFSGEDILIMLGVETNATILHHDFSHPVYTELKIMPATLDDLRQKLQISATDLLQQLTYLEIEKKVKQDSMGVYYPL